MLLVILEPRSLKILLVLLNKSRKKERVVTFFPNLIESKLIRKYWGRKRRRRKKEGSGKELDRNVSLNGVVSFTISAGFAVTSAS